MANTRLRVYSRGGQSAVVVMYMLALGAVVMALSTALPRFADLRGVVPWMFGAAAVLCVVGWLLSRALAYRIDVVDGKLRIVGRNPIDIGAPKKLRRGQFSQTVHVPHAPGVVGLAGKALLDGEQSVTAWLAVEGATEKPVVFMAPLGVLGSIDWPAGDPPAAHAQLYVGPRMIRKLEHAVGDLV